MKILLLFLFFALNQSFAQWKSTLNQSENKINAIGEFTFSFYKQDTIVLNLSKFRNLDLDFVLEGDYFKTSEKYYVLFEIDERKIKVLSSEIEKGKLRLLKFKDLVSKEEYEIQDFLKTLKSGSECILTMSNGLKVIQGFNKLNGSENAINSVLRGN